MEELPLRERGPPQCCRNADPLSERSAYLRRRRASNALVSMARWQMDLVTQSSILFVSEKASKFIELYASSWTSPRCRGSGSALSFFLHLTQEEEGGLVVAVP